MNSMLTTLLIVLGGCLGAYATYQIQRFGLSPVVASCLVGLIGAVIAYFLKNEDLAMVIFAGSFVGMTAATVASTPMIILAGLTCGLLYAASTHLFDGYGGKLGALAFISVGLILLLFWLFKK